MKGIEGNLSSLSITDLMQWIEVNRKSGALILKRDSEGRCFCFEEGSLMFASFGEEGRRFVDFLSKEIHIEAGRINETVLLSRENGGSFVSRLIDRKLVPLEFMKAAMEHITEAVLMDILTWTEGSFQFFEELPVFLSGSPVRLNTNHVIFESVRKHDEGARPRR